MRWERKALGKKFLKLERVFNQSHSLSLSLSFNLETETALENTEVYAT